MKAVLKINTDNPKKLNSECDILVKKLDKISNCLFFSESHYVPLAFINLGGGEKKKNKDFITFARIYKASIASIISLASQGGFR